MVRVIRRDEDETTSAQTARGNQPQARSSIIGRETVEAKSEATEILDEARAQAEEILAAAKTEAANLRDVAKAEGRQEGIDEGAKEVAQIIKRMAEHQQEQEAQVLPQLLKLVRKMAEKVIGSELEQRPEALVGMIKRTLHDKARQRRSLLLRVNPADLEVVRNERHRLMDALVRASDLSIREDEDISPGGVMIETEAGSIDARLETQLDALERAMFGQ
jgi:type III secretion protein L